MEPELLLVALAVILLVGCGARGGSTETRIAPDLPPVPAAQKSEPEMPRPAYGLPLDIRIEVPEPPKEIQGPSAPIPPGTPMPGGILSPFGGENK
jgi:hypothetical protein